MDQDNAVVQSGSGAIAQDRGAAVVGDDNVVITGDVRGNVSVVNVTFQGVQMAIPAAQAVAGHRAALRERLAREARARWGGMSAYIQEEGAMLPVEASPYQVGRLGPRQNLLGMLHAAHRLLVLGEPGSGKTVALERLAWGLCDGPEPAVPVLVRLFHYDGAPLEKWVRALLQEMGRLRLDDDRALAAFLQESEPGVFSCLTA